MKLLPCAGSVDCLSLGAMLPMSLKFPHGEPALVGAYQPEMKCARCKRRNRYSTTDYARLPQLSPEDYVALARLYRAPQLASLHTRDFVGMGHTTEQAVDLYRAGFRSTNELHAVDRDATVESAWNDLAVHEAEERARG